MMKGRERRPDATVINDSHVKLDEISKFAGCKFYGRQLFLLLEYIQLKIKNGKNEKNEVVS